MKTLELEDIPRWYTLTIDKDTGFPCIVIYKHATSLVGVFHPDVISRFRGEFGLKYDEYYLTEILSNTFGFNTSSSKLIEKVAEDQFTLTYRLNLPIIKKLGDTKCSYCNNGIKHKTGDICSYCDGGGKEYDFDYKPAYALSLGLQMLLYCLSDTTTISEGLVDIKQLLTLNIVTNNDMNGGSVFGQYSPYMVSLLKLMGEDIEFTEAEEIMMKVHCHMWQGTKYHLREFRAYQHLPANLIISVPGDACDICTHPHVHEIKEGDGVQFSPHNMDTLLQQFTVITGLAAVCDILERLKS